MTRLDGAGRRRKGASAEVALVKHLRATGAFPYAERRGGGFGGSDVIGTPGITFESKNVAGLKLGMWTDQTEAARIASGDTYGVLVVKRSGTTNPGRWHAVMPLDQLLALLAEAGWAAPQSTTTQTMDDIVNNPEADDAA